MNGRPALLASLGLALTLAAPGARAQVPESEDDPTGMAIPYPLFHLEHSDRVDQEAGSTASLRARDPFLLYQLGRDLVRRSYTLEQGVFGRPGEMSVPLYVTSVHGASAADVRLARDHASSCGTCHSVPFGEPGAGQTIPSTSSAGRNTPHFYGAGLVEMLGDQVRREILALADANRDGVIDQAEARAAPAPLRIEPVPGAPAVDYGTLAPDPSGVPALNGAFRLWYVDASGQVLPEAQGLGDPGVAAFGFTIQPFGWGRGQRRGPDGRRHPEGGEATTVREFFAIAADTHMGLQAYDPTQLPVRGAAAGVGGLARVSLSGQQQYNFGGSPDRGGRLEDGRSLDDPDGDGHLNELTGGDLDAVEHYLLNAPAPAVRATAGSEPGHAVLIRAGCTRCHVESWDIHPRDDRLGFTGDRRTFDLRVRAQVGPDGTGRLSAQLVRLDRPAPDGTLAPARGGFRVERIYSDFKHWDLGPAFHERRYDGSVQREHRTAPLWGVGSTAPYGHAGQFPDLDGAIAAHAGAAAAERRQYLALSQADRAQLLAYLESLVLYSTDAIPADVDGDGAIAAAFRVGGRAVGGERFDPRFLFSVPPRFRVLHDAVGPGGEPAPLLRLENVRQAYRLDLLVPARKAKPTDANRPR